MIVSQANIKQHIWRERQLDIFYRTGRPIYTLEDLCSHENNLNNTRIII